MKPQFLTMILLVLASASTWAQSSTSTLSLPTSTLEIGVPTSPTQSLTASLKQEEAALGSKFAASAYFNFMTDALPVNYKETRKTADIASENYVELGYKLSSDSQISLRHNFDWTVAGASNGSYVSIDPSIVYTTKGPKLGDFEPLKGIYYFFVPVSEESRVSHQLGYFRADLSMDYNATTKWVLTPFAITRLYLNSSENQVTPEGSDSRLRLVGGGTATYNFNDILNVYYAPYIDVATTDFNRGSLRPNGETKVAGMVGERWNHLIHEVGLGWNVTKNFSVTPAVLNYVSMNTGIGFGREESLEYDLYVSAVY